MTLAERVEELNAAAAELSEVRGALERRGEALALAERARDDADRRVRTLEEAERASRSASSRKKTTKTKTTREKGGATKTTSDEKPVDETPASAETRIRRASGGAAAWAAANAGSFSETLSDAFSEDDPSLNLRATQAEVEERLRAARATWETRERDLRRRVRQLEAAAEAFDFAGAAKGDGPSRESLRILAEQAEKALRQR